MPGIALAARMRRLVCGLSAGLLAAALGPAMIGDAHAADLKGLDRMVETYRTRPVFTPPAPAFNAKACVAGKSMMAIPASSSVPFMNEIQEGMQKLAQQAGLKMTEWRNQGQNSQWIQGIDAAINAKDTLIDLCCGLDPTTLAPQLTEAHKAGLKIVASHMTGFGYKAPGYVDAQVPADFYKVGQLLAAWTLVRTHGAPDVLVVTSDEIVSTTPLVAGFRKTMAAQCPSCKVRYINVPVPDWATRIQTSLQSALLSDPKVNYIVPIYDSMAQFVIPALRLTGKTGSVKVATFNGTPFALDMVRNGEVEMDIGESLDWIAHAIMDADMRLICGMSAPADPKIPLYIFDASNVKDAGVPARTSTGYGDSYVTGYRKLWGME